MNSPLPAFTDLAEEFDFLDRFERTERLIEIGRTLEPMPDALKTDTTRVQGCAASVWIYLVKMPGNRLHFMADSNAATTKGIVALILMTIQDKLPAEILSVDIPELLTPFHLQKHLSSNRTQGIPNMIALIRETAARYA